MGKVKALPIVFGGPDAKISNLLAAGGGTLVPLVAEAPSFVFGGPSKAQIAYEKKKQEYLKKKEREKDEYKVKEQEWERQKAMAAAQKPAAVVKVEKEKPTAARKIVEKREAGYERENEKLVKRLTLAGKSESEISMALNHQKWLQYLGPEERMRRREKTEEEKKKSEASIKAYQDKLKAEEEAVKKGKEAYLAKRRDYMREYRKKKKGEE